MKVVAEDLHNFFSWNHSRSVGDLLHGYVYHWRKAQNAPPRHGDVDDRTPGCEQQEHEQRSLAGGETSCRHSSGSSHPSTSPAIRPRRRRLARVAGGFPTSPMTRPRRGQLPHVANDLPTSSAFRGRRPRSGGVVRDLRMSSATCVRRPRLAHVVREFRTSSASSVRRPRSGGVVRDLRAPSATCARRGKASEPHYSPPDALRVRSA